MKRDLARRVAILELEADEFYPEAAEDESAVHDLTVMLMDESEEVLRARLRAVTRNVS